LETKNSGEKENKSPFFEAPRKVGKKSPFMTTRGEGISKSGIIPKIQVSSSTMKEETSKNKQTEEIVYVYESDEEQKKPTNKKRSIRVAETPRVKRRVQK